MKIVGTVAKVIFVASAMALIALLMYMAVRAHSSLTTEVEGMQCGYTNIYIDKTVIGDCYEK